jgi:hypothetical protein
MFYISANQSYIEQKTQFFFFSQLTLQYSNTVLKKIYIVITGYQLTCIFNYEKKEKKEHSFIILKKKENTMKNYIIVLTE